METEKTNKKDTETKAVEKRTVAKKVVTKTAEGKTGQTVLAKEVKREIPEEKRGKTAEKTTQETTEKKTAPKKVETKTAEKKTAGRVLQKRGLVMQIKQSKPDERKEKIGKFAGTVGEAMQSYRTLKEAILRREENNYTEIIALRAKVGGSWWKLFDHSAIFYANVICPQLRPLKSAKIKEDTDFGQKAKIGWVSIKDIVALKNDLLSLKAEVYDKTEMYVIFKLGTEMSMDEVVLAKNERAQKFERVNKLLLPANVPTRLNADLKKLAELIFAEVRRMDKIHREMLGQTLADATVKARSVVMRVSMGVVPAENGYDAVLEALVEIRTYLWLIMDANLMELNKMAEITYVLTDVKRSLREAMERAALTKTKRKLEGKSPLESGD